MRARSAGPLFLAELVAMILVFALCAGLLLNLFASARETSRGTDALGSAVLWADSAASAYKAAGGDAPQAAARLSEAARADADGFTLGFDAAWEPCADGARYTLTLRADGAGAARVSVADGARELFALTVRAR